MPQKTITIDRERRDGLYELVRNHLGAIGDFWLVFEKDRDYEAAERLGLEFAADFRLLADIGWGERDPRERYALTMPPHELAPLLRRLQRAAVEMLIETGSEAEARRREAERARSFQLGYEACGIVLADLDPEPGR